MGKLKISLSKRMVNMFLFSFARLMISYIFLKNSGLCVYIENMSSFYTRFKHIFFFIHSFVISFFIIIIQTINEHIKTGVIADFFHLSISLSLSLALPQYYCIIISSSQFHHSEHHRYYLTLNQLTYLKLNTAK